MGLRSLTLADFSDADLLWALEEAGDAEGWATAAEVAKLIGLDAKHPGRCVGSRFSWLKRYGVMDSEWRTVKREDEEGTQRLVFWRLNDVGEDLLHAREKKLPEFTEGQRVQAMEALASDLKGGSRESIHMGIRAYRHQIGNWRDSSLFTKRKGKK